MLGALFKMVTQAATKVPWWKVLAMAAGTAAATAAGSKVVDKIIQDRNKSPKWKIAHLEALKDKGVITEAEFKDLKKKVLESFASRP
jgi:predicted transcriptional regulator